MKALPLRAVVLGLLLSTALLRFKLLADDEVEKIYFEYYVANCGEKFDCYFTIERRLPVDQSKPPPAFHRQYRADWRGVENLDAALARLAKEFDDVEILRCASNPKVIHLIQRGLRNTPDCVLDRKADIDYSGGLHGLLDALAAKYGIALRERAIATNDGIDLNTQTKISIRGKTIREILTEAVPLKGYYQVIWEANTYLKDGKPETGVGFTGPLE
jgi:hypothetical protein